MTGSYDFWTREEAAAALGGTVDDVDALVAAGNLAPVQMSPGGVSLFVPGQVSAAADLAKAKGVTIEDLKAMSPQEVANLSPDVVARALQVSQVAAGNLTDPSADEVAAAVAGAAAGRAKVQEVTVEALSKMNPQDVARLSPEAVARALQVKQMGAAR